MTWAQTRKKALEHTKNALKESVNDDNLISQTISAMEELDRTANTLSRRLREWYELHSPEFSKAIPNNDAFARAITTKSKSEQLKELKVTLSMGADLQSGDINQMKSFAHTIITLFSQRKQLESYLDRLLQKHAPNLLILAGNTIAAKLLREAGSLKKLASIQSSTIQLYGAEKALFRHIKTGAKPPKYGYLIHHPLVTSAPPKNKGKVARALADKISIACRVDYFKGSPIGQKLKKELEERFS